MQRRQAVRRPTLAAAALVVAALLPLGTAASNTTDAEVLLAFKAQFENGDTALSSWKGADPCGGSWEGVGCKDGAVVALQLTFKGLEGTIPAGGYLLPDSLLHFGIEGNSVRGTLPDTIAFPPGIANYSLALNSLTGTVPQYALPEGLQWLNLGSNGFNGTLPATGYKLPSTMQFFYLDNNQLSGTLPATWDLPPSLQILTLFSNRFTGSVPPWKLPTSMRWLNLCCQQLSGTLPAEWPMPQSTDTLGIVLQNNNLTGTLPTWRRSPTPVVAYVSPGNPGLCGPIPPASEGTFYAIYTSPSLSLPTEGAMLQSLPSCNATSAPSNSSNSSGGGGSTSRGGGSTIANGSSSAAASSSSSSSTSGGGSSNASTVALAVGLGVGCTAALLAAAGGLAWRRRRRRLAARQAGEGSYLEKGSPGTELASKGGLRTDSELSSGGSQGGGPPTPPLPPPISTNLLASDPLLTFITAKLHWDNTGLAPAAAASPVQAASRTGPSSPFEGAQPPHQAEAVKRPQPRREEALAMQPSQPSSAWSGDMKLWHINWSALSLERQIGAGSFGRVYLAQWGSHTTVAVKLLLGGAAGIADVSAAAEAVLSLSSPKLRALRQEAEINAALRHPNIVQFLGLCTRPAALISEYCPRGSLYDTLQEARQRPRAAAQLGWPRRLEMALCAAKGMAYLHSQRILHRDLKSPNLLLMEDWTVKVSDFSFSKLFELEGERSAAQSSVTVLNPRWLAPEVLAGQQHSPASDVYSFGCLLYELLTFKLPWSGAGFWQVTAAVCRGERPEVPPAEELPGGGFERLDGYLALLQRCWAQAPAERPAFDAVIRDLRHLITGRPPGGLSRNASSGSLATASGRCSGALTADAQPLSAGTGGSQQQNGSGELSQAQQRALCQPLRAVVMDHAAVPASPFTAMSSEQQQGPVLGPSALSARA